MKQTTMANDWQPGDSPPPTEEPPYEPTPPIPPPPPGKDEVRSKIVMSGLGFAIAVLAGCVLLLLLSACESFLALARLGNVYHAAAVEAAGRVDDDVGHLLADACKLAAKQLAGAAAEAQKALLNEEPGAKIKAHSAELAREKMIATCKAAGIRPGAPPPPPKPAVVTTDMGPAVVPPPAPAAPTPPASVVVPAPPSPPITPPLPVLGVPLGPAP